MDQLTLQSPSNERSEHSSAARRRLCTNWVQVLANMNMPDPIFLTRAQVAELTGARTRRRQIEVLVRNGVRHTINAAGWPVVTRAAVEGQPEQPQIAGWTPNKRAA